MNVMSKITKVAVTKIKKETTEEENSLGSKNIATNFVSGAPRNSVSPDKLMAKLQTLAEESGSEEDENTEGILQRSTPANLFSQL